MPLAEAETQTLLIVLPTLTLVWETLRMVFTGQEILYGMIYVSVLNLLQCSL